MCSVQRYSNIYQHVVAGKVVLLAMLSLSSVPVFALCPGGVLGNHLHTLTWSWGSALWHPEMKAPVVQQWIKVFAVVIYMCLWRSHS